MAANDPVLRRLAATVASNAYRAHPDAPRRLDPDDVPVACLSEYIDEVDPDRSLEVAERTKRARAAFRRDRARRALEARQAELAATVRGGTAGQ